MSSQLRRLNHVTGFLIFATCTYYQVFLLFQEPHQRGKPDPTLRALRTQHQSHGGNWKYLTFLGLIAQLVYFTLALLDDMLAALLSPTSWLRRTLEKRCDQWLASLALPTAFLVGSTFWGIYWIDRELIFPRLMDRYYPRGLNHGVHTAPILAMLVELCTLRRSLPPRRDVYLPLVGFMLAYFSGVVVYLGIGRGYWVYAVLQVLAWPARCAFIALTLCLALMFAELGKLANSYLCNDTAQRHTDPQRKRK